MFRYTLKFTLRNIFRNKLFSILNILGLTLGLAGTILILLWIWNEVSYDRFYKNVDNIYLLVNKNTDDNGNSVEYVESPSPMADYLQSNFPEVKKTARVDYFYNGGLIQKGNDIFKEKGAAVDSSFLDIFSISFKYGSRHDALTNPESIIISEDMAERYYGGLNPIGKILKVKGYGDTYKTVKITGVYKNFPYNSTIQFDFIIPFSLEEKYYSDNWNISIYTTFVQLSNEYNLKELNNKVSSIYKNVIDDDHYSSYLYPFKKLYLYSTLTFFNNYDRGNIKLIYLMSFVAVLILLIACINYMNLATARSVKKQKEISIKKILGANRKRLVLDFLTDTVLFTLISFQLAIILVEIIRPLFNRITGKEITINYFEPQLLLIAFLILAVISSISAIYPYLFLKSNKPVNFLRNIVLPGTNKFNAKKVLVVFQFIISTILIIFAGFVTKQVNYIYSKDLGFDKQNIIVVNSNALSGKEKVFKDMVLKNPDVICASIGKTPFGGGWPDSWSWDGKTGQSRLDVMRISSDSDYLKTLGIKLLSGRFFKKEFVDSGKIVINKKFADLMGKNDVIGKKIIYREHKYEIIGVINNIYSHHFSEGIKPVAIFNEPTHKFLIKVRDGKMTATIDYLKSDFNKLVEDRAFEYSTLQNQFDSIFKKEVRFGKLFGYFSLLAIFISCLGLFGVSVFASEQKTKEIGIRKVLGASSYRITRMLNSEFLKLVFIAFVISCPISYYISKKWLQSFVYKTDLSWWIFAVAGIVVFLISSITICWYSIRIARRNPVESLRYE